MRAAKLALAISLSVTLFTDIVNAQHRATPTDSLRSAHRALYKEGRVNAAIAVARDEIALRRGTDGEPVTDVAVSLRDLGKYLYMAGRYAASDSLLREALEIQRTAYGKRDPRLAETLNARVAPLLKSGKVDAAREACQEALDINLSSDDPGPAALAESHHWMGDIDRASGGEGKDSFESGARHFEESLRLRRDLYGPENIDVAATLVAYGHLLAWNGDLSAAETMLRDGVAMQRRLLPPDHVARAEGLLHLAFALRGLGDTRDAVDVLREHIDILERSVPQHPQVVQSQNNLALLLKDDGQYEESAALMRQNILDYEKNPDDVITALLYMRANLALVYILMEEYDTADHVLEQAFEELSSLELRGVDAAHVRLTLGHRRAMLQVGVGDFSSAEASWRALIDALAVAEAHSDVVAAYEQLARARVGQGDIQGGLEYCNEAIRCFEMAREKTGGGQRAATFAHTPYEAQAVIRLELSQYEQAWRDIESARGRVLAELLIKEETPFTLDRVQSALSPTEAIVGWVDYELLPKDVRSWGFVIRDHGPVSWERLPSNQRESTRSHGQRFAAFRNELAGLGTSAFTAARSTFPMETARDLWRERIGPLEKHLDGVDALILTPSGVMAGFPVGALVDDTGTFAGERYAISFAPSCAIRTWFAEAKRGKQHSFQTYQGLLIGDPAFSEEHMVEWVSPSGSAAGTQVASAELLRSATRGNEAAMQMLPRLPWSRVEVEGVADILPDATVLLGAEASAANVRRIARSGEIARYDILHVATHALVDAARPERSAFILAKVEPASHSTYRSDRDYVVTAAEIEREWKLDADLVVLSACETALGRNVYGEGTIGFAYPLFLVGARAVVASLWPVSDEASALLMKQFYAHWIEGAGEEVTKAQALQEAKRWLREQRDDRGHHRYAHPYYWAAFTLVGE
jgi:CHAT domain-containing protein/tetratricopeptide (TPR) repeat protein